MLFPSMGTLRIFPSISLIIIIILVCLTCGTIGAKRKSYHNSNSNHGVNARTYNGKGGNKIAPLSVAGPERESEFGTRGKICIGTNGRMSVPSNRDHHYRNMKERFTNCTYVDGNLELTWLQDENLDLSFLQYIREVTGYVLISHVDIKRIVLPQLQIIRGRTLFKINVHDEEFALMVTLSKMYSLELPALRDVLNGSVGLFNNYNLCHIKTINWSEIITDSKGKYVYVYNFTSPERECSCDKSCEAGCWGEGAKNCQEFSKINCSPQCELGRCFGPNPRQCCHLFCAGGCYGPKQSDCIACKNFYDDGMCTQECPSMQVYDMTSYSWVPNPNGKYAYGATCVKNCPEHLLKDSGACVRTCPPNKKAVNGECVPCDGPCPKTCQADGLIHAGNIDNYKECTVIEGYVHILENSFKGYQQIFPNYTFGDRYPPMHPDRLEVFSTLKEITGFINIQAYHEDFKNLSYFRNLEVIGGRTLHEFSSLYIVKTSLESLDLRSLKRINSGSVIILENKHLCFANNVNWKTIKKSEHAVQIENNSDLKSCKNRGLICSDQCSRDGCWGPGSDQCLSCSHYQLGNMCLQNCSILMGIYDSGKMTCKPCHEQCGLSCHGPGADNCTTCKNFRDGPFCVSECPKTKYEQSGVCKPCHENCIDGCTGPNNTLGAGGCNSCDKVIMNENHFETCLHKTEPCPDGYFYEWVRTEQQDFLKPLDGKAICRRCHPRCKKCTSYGFHENVCQQCTKYKKGEQCEDECADDDYADETTNECLSCHEECRGCIGPGADNCLACKNFKLYDDGDAANNGSFTCALTCPPDYPHRVFPDNKSDAYCSAYATGTVQSPLATSNVSIMIICGAIIIGVCIFALAFLYFYNCRKLKSKEKALKMTMTLTGLDDNEPLRPSNVMPNLAQLRIIKEIDIRKGEVLGYGAFGTVYKGVWVPEGESNKIPVAIKVLREDTGVNTSKEFLGEAYIMATVDHPNLLQLLAVCMTSQMMLITQLMPLGCLLDFVRNNKDKIGSKPLLTWCTQIAKGMAYLEEKRLVHRDLAARNVLVQTPTCVKITDFGLAKLLDINEEEYKAAGGKMPIKWLALECIQHRIFTHKSDVWAFGVTVWELLTYGGRPYDNVPARDVPELLESGERLPQPSICTIDVYMIMIKCWMLDAESRPGFKELAEDFAKMCRDPGRYLVIQGDKHIRLHNYPNHDDRDTLRSMSSIVDHSGGQIEGDEYLQPKSRAPISISSHSPPSTSMKFWPSGSSHIASDESCAPQNQHNWDRERLRYAQGHGLDPNVLRHVSDGSSIKYCDDSLRKFKANDLGSDEFDSGRSHQAQVGTVKLELLVDEDDYLMPSPQQVQPSTTYVDFGDGSRSTENVSANDSCANMYKNYSDLCKTNIDNPEYLMNNDAPCQTVGIPTVSELVQANCSGTSAINASNINRDARGSVSNDNSGNNVNNINSNTAHPYLPQKSSEEESDHEYYNDIDRLKRELQPLHKSETTV